MKYENVQTGTFIDRPNRFIARVTADGETLTCHVKNTGRCRELLLPGARVALARAQNPNRKTEWDLIAVWKGELLINIDSQAPNAVFAEWAKLAGFPPGLKRLTPEVTRGDSRFDFGFEAGRGAGFIEVKGVTLENGGAASFPDAPTSRGVKHIKGLIDCAQSGLDAYLAFVVQMRGMRFVAPNAENDPEFARTLCAAARAGVGILALECAVNEDSMEICGEVPLRLPRDM